MNFTNIISKFFKKSQFLFGLKLSVAAIAAILVARLLHLDNVISAGIVAILSVAPTKKETVKTATDRLIAFVAALIIAYVLFKFIGVNVWAFMVYLVIFAQVCIAFKWSSALTIDSVLISHFISAGVMNVYTVYNELMIFFIGAGFGILVNLHLKKRAQYIELLKEDTDAHIRNELHRMAQRIVNPELEGFDGHCFEEMWMSVFKAKSLAQENFMNQLRHPDRGDIEYIEMRERQVEVLHQMYLIVTRIHTTPTTARVIADFLEKVSFEYHRDNSGEELLALFHRIDEEMKKTKLPVTRTEFEDRAQLYGLMRRIEEFLQIKYDYHHEAKIKYDRNGVTLWRKKHQK